MKRYFYLYLAVIFSIFTLGINTTLAEEQVYGWELMSAQERQQHQEKMRSFKTEQERERYRLEHHQQMLERAKQRGVTLPDSPPHERQQNRDRDSMGPGQGPGAGMGGGKR